MKGNEMKTKWPPTRSHVEQLEKKAALYQQLLNKEIQQPFVDEFTRNLGVLHALKPYSRWSEETKTAAKHAAKLYPVGWLVYKSALPGDVYLTALAQYMQTKAKLYSK